MHRSKAMGWEYVSIVAYISMPYGSNFMYPSIGHKKSLTWNKRICSSVALWITKLRFDSCRLDKG
jgi:hypothetical protein